MTRKQSEAQRIDGFDPEPMVIVPLKHPWRWTAIILVSVSIAAAARSAISNPEFQWPVVGQYLFNPLILNGLAQTLLITLVVMILATIGGTIAALMMLSKSRLLSAPAAIFVWFFRGTPALVQLILWYNLSIVVKNLTLWLPGLGTVYSVPTNDVMTPLVSAIVALSLHESGYMAEIVRSGLKSVNRGQYEASACLGMKPSLALRRIVLPQAMRMIIPPTGNETINLLKTTSLVSIIAVGDLLYSAQSIYARTFETIPLLLVVSFWYLAVVSVMSVGQFHLERHFSRDERRSNPSMTKVIFGSLIKMRQKEILA
ncbi:amino acid ABC transporter permease [Rhizobium etli]|uniref:amino acid ABC transporter permease n=1 Tax=Rhizobium etli TaxID=29449 RepID=UPI0003839B2E|nr:amino acid ABC transporter permease [Rhizobium etli]AGS25557.1 amino acid ABC transporter permease protein [Rhizobium etli bv. mimosae str. Mim1]